MLKYGAPLEATVVGELKGQSYLGRKYQAGDRLAYVCIEKAMPNDPDKVLVELTTICHLEEDEFTSKYVELKEGYAHRQFPTFKEK